MIGFSFYSDIVIVKWQNKQESVFSFLSLRKLCPCAFCSGEKDVFGNTYAGNSQKIDQNIKITKYSLIGTKGQSFFRSFGGNVVSATEKLGDDPSIEQLVGSMKILLDAFAEGEYDRVYLASNKFVNTMTQQPGVEQLLPLKKIESEEEKPRWDYIYEPDDSRTLLDGLMGRYIESLVYQAVIENIACEQAAKMVAMKSATDNAGNLIEELQLVYNNARQAAITQEISEIVGGAEAL